MTSRVAFTAHYTIPEDDFYHDGGYCGGCNDERPYVRASTTAHTCGMYQPADGIVISVRERTATAINPTADDFNTEDLPF